MTDVIMPQMGESIAEGTVTKWMKNVGDRVERDEPLFEISTDKVDAEIPSPASGVLKEIRVAPGTTVPINTVVGVIAAEGEAVASPPAAAATPPPPVAPPAPPAAPVAAAPAPPPPRPPAPAPVRSATAGQPGPRGVHHAGLRSGSYERRRHRARAGARSSPATERDDRRGAAPDALVARRAQDRGGAPGGPPRHPRDRDLGT